VIVVIIFKNTTVASIFEGRSHDILSRFQQTSCPTVPGDSGVKFSLDCLQVRSGSKTKQDSLTFNPATTTASNQKVQDDFEILSVVQNHLGIQLPEKPFMEDV
jgi:hypothetical protein